MHSIRVLLATLIVFSIVAIFVTVAVSLSSSNSFSALMDFIR